MFCTRVAWVCLVCLRLCKEEGSFPGYLQLLRRGIWACNRNPSVMKKQAKNHDVDDKVERVTVLPLSQDIRSILTTSHR